MKAILILIAALVALVGFYFSVAEQGSHSAAAVPETNVITLAAGKTLAQVELADKDSMEPTRKDMQQLRREEFALGLQEVDQESGQAPDMHVFVQDSKGRAVPFFPVRLCSRSSSGRFGWSGPRGENRVRADSEGVARFPLQLLAIEPQAPQQLFVVSGLAWQSDSFVELTAAHLGGELLILEVPTQGTAEVRLMTVQGEPYTGQARVYADLGANQRLAKITPNGSYWIHALPLGRSLRFVVGRGGRFPEEEWQEAAFSRGNSHRVIPFEIGRTLPRVKGVLVRETGLPLSQGVSAVKARGKRLETLQTDSKGAFEIELSRTEGGHLTFQASQDGQWQDSQAEVEMPDLQARQTKDLGRIKLVRRPILVSGFLRSSKQGKLVCEINVEGQQGDGSWETLASTTNDALGQFYLAGQSDCAQLRITVRDVTSSMVVRSEGVVMVRQWRSIVERESTHYVLVEPVTCTPGTEGLVVWVDQAVLVVGRIEGARGRKLQVVFAYENGKKRTLPVRKIRNAPGLSGEEFSGYVLPGTATVIIMDVDAGKPILTLGEFILTVNAKQSPKLSTIVLE